MAWSRLVQQRSRPGTSVGSGCQCDALAAAEGHRQYRGRGETATVRFRSKRMTRFIYNFGSRAHMATTPAAASALPDFETNLLDACDDMSVCAKGFFCPCILVGEIHERMGQEFGAFCCLNFFGNNIGLSCARRGIIRAAYNLPESPCGDCLAVTCCGPCATIQEYHQVNKKVFPLRPDMNQWNTGLFDCAEDGYMCTKGCLCPCMLSADALNYLGAPWFCMCMCPIACAARTLIRQTYNIDGTFCKDILTSAPPPPAPCLHSAAAFFLLDSHLLRSYVLCCPCATCQEARFMRKVNMDIPLGTVPAATSATPPVAASRM